MTAQQRLQEHIRMFKDSAGPPERERNDLRGSRRLQLTMTSADALPAGLFLAFPGSLPGTAGR